MPVAGRAISRPSLKNLANTAWRLMSLWVRQSEADPNGYCRCVSCGKSAPWIEFDAGHFVHAGNGGKQNPVSYDRRNIHPQCISCNRQGWKHYHPGQTTIHYTRYMVREYGDSIVDQLEAIKKQPWFRHQELEEQIKLLKTRIEALN